MNKSDQFYLYLGIAVAVVVAIIVVVWIVWKRRANLRAQQTASISQTQQAMAQTETVLPAARMAAARPSAGFLTG